MSNKSLKSSQLSAAEMLANPTALPIRSLSLLAQSPVLVVAPHPDDETLGCGGTIALLRSLGCEVYTLVISDGTRSHPRSRKYPETALRTLREQETIAGLSILGVEPQSVTFLRLQDGAVPTPSEAGFSAAVDRCCTYLNQLSFNPLSWQSLQLILLPWRADPHPDHRASWQLIQTVLTELAITPRQLEYPIWDWDVQQRGKALAKGQDEGAFVGWRIDISAVLAEKRQAIAQYRSQVTDLIDDDPQGFRLVPEMIANFTRPWEIFFEDIKNDFFSSPASISVPRPSSVPTAELF
jgi:LmbE family N-acetylglucosaminyl deacetylase